MVYRNSILSPEGYRYDVITLESINEEVISDRGVIAVYNGAIVGVTGPDETFNSDKSARYGFTYNVESDDLEK